MIDDDGLDFDPADNGAMPAAEPASAMEPPAAAPAPMAEQPAWPTPNERHIARLKQDQATADLFEMKFGPGSASKALGIGMSETAKAMAPKVEQQTAGWWGRRVVSDVADYLDEPSRQIRRYLGLPETPPDPMSTVRDAVIERTARGVLDMGELQRGAVRGIYSTQEMLGSGVEQYGKTLGSEAIAGTGTTASDQAKEISKSEFLKARVESFSNIRGERFVSDTADYLAAKLGEGVGNISTIGAMYGAGGVAGGMGFLATMSIGEVRSELKEAGITDEATIAPYAYAGGLVVAALESVFPAHVLRELSEPVKKEIGRHVLRQTIRGAYGGAWREGITEGLQEAVQIAAVAHALDAGELLDTKPVLEALQRGENVTRIIDAMVGGALPGGMLGAQSSAVRAQQGVQEARARGGSSTATDASPTAETPPAPAAGSAAWRPDQKTQAVIDDTVEWLRGLAADSGPDARWGKAVLDSMPPPGAPASAWRDWGQYGPISEIPVGSLRNRGAEIAAAADNAMPRPDARTVAPNVDGPAEPMRPGEGAVQERREPVQSDALDRVRALIGEKPPAQPSDASDPGTPTIEAAQVTVPEPTEDEVETELPAAAAEIEQFYAESDWPFDLDDTDVRAVTRNRLKGMPVDEALETYFDQRHAALARQRDGKPREEPAQAEAPADDTGPVAEPGGGLPEVGRDGIGPVGEGAIAGDGRDRGEPGGQDAAEDVVEDAAPAAEITDSDRRDFARVLAGKTPRNQWRLMLGSGASNAQLQALIDEAVADGRLAMRNGVPRRTAKAKTIPEALRAAPAAQTSNQQMLDAARQSGRLEIVTVGDRRPPDELDAITDLEQLRSIATAIGTSWRSADTADEVRRRIVARRNAIADGGQTVRSAIAASAPRPAPAMPDLLAVRPADEARRTLVERLQSTGFKTIVEARKFAKDAGIKATGKALDEMIEQAVVDAAREIVARETQPQDAYQQLVALYDRQPNLAVRTSTSVANQAYSTPMPLAYVASRLAGVRDAGSVYEPSAGNGALLIEADPARQRVVANELEANRAGALKALGFETTTADATDPRLAAGIRAAGPAGSVIMNPPFGAVRESGKSKSWEVDGFRTTQVDHAIALEGLKAMADDGRAVLILGGIKAKSEAELRKGYRGQAKREFYFRLYSQYNVVDHFTVSGDLYRKQGAGWPVDVVVIEGRAKSQRPLPAVQLPVMMESWDALAEKLDGVDAGTAVQPDDRVDPGVGEPDGRDADALDDAGRGGDGALPVQAGDDAGGLRGDVDRGEPGSGGSSSDAPGVPEQSIGLRDAGAVDEQPAPREQRVRKQPQGGGQALYEPVSESGALDTLIPVNMASAARSALERIREKHGSLDALVADRLGYAVDSAGLPFFINAKEEVVRPFSAEQIDALAAAIDNVESGAAFILGDQTGIGKGRVVAGMLRYAMKRGLTPVLVTEKPDLYGDMYRDLRDIGVTEMLGREPSMFMTNGSESVTLDEAALEWKQEVDFAKASGQKLPPKRGRFLTGATPAKALGEMRSIVNREGKYDVVFTTYDQMNTVKGQTTPRRQFLEAIKRNALIAFDESHNAGGAAKTGWESKNAPLNRADFARELSRDAAGVIYSSATYAKRPDVMDLYARTDMGKAVDDPKNLPALIQGGGVPMQQVVATMLSDAGQYIRRERSFDGVEYAVEGVPVNAAAYRQFSDAISAVFRFDMAMKDIRPDLIQSVLDEQGAALGNDTGVGEVSATTTSFSSIMHNLISQMLLSIKADAVAQRAIEAMQAGEKPVIALANTNESFLKSFAEQEGIEIGQAMELDFGAMLNRYLTRTLRVTIRNPDKTQSHYQIPIEDLPPGLQDQYAAAQATITDGDFSALPVSPIDWIRARVTQAGASIAEVTGRGTMIDYTQASPTYVNRPKSEQGPSGKRGSIAAFNAGKLDVLILNRSGSTGVSMHASVGFKDQRRRRMILAQADPNIDTHLQMLGRVHRTGQIIPPAYSQVAADIPAEARPTAVLMRKMASLNANTTGARGSVFMADSVDFMNEIGDEVVMKIMAEQPELDDQLGNPLKTDDEGLPIATDAAKLVTGRLVLLDPQQQSDLLDQIQSAYKAELQQLDALGENPLEAKTLDLQAQPISSTVLKERSGDGPFRDEVRIEEMSVRVEGRAMSMEDVLGAVSQSLGVEVPEGDGVAGLNSLAEKRREWALAQIERVRAETKEWAALDIAALSEKAQPKAAERHAVVLDRWEATARVAYPGSRVKVALPVGEMEGIVLSVDKTGKARNPSSLGSWTVRIAVPDGMRVLEFPFSKLFPQSVKMSLGDKGAAISASGTSFRTLAEQFEQARKEGRENRYIVTGNILGGYESVAGKGRIVNFTSADGQIKPGVLMGREFSLEKHMAQRAVRFGSGQQVARFMEEAPRSPVKSTDGNIVLGKSWSGWTIELPASRAVGGRFYTDDTVRNAIAPAEFVKRGNKMIANVDRVSIVRAIDAMRGIGATFETRTEQDKANEVIRLLPAAEVPGGSPAMAAMGRQAEDQEPETDAEPEAMPPPADYGSWVRFRHIRNVLARNLGQRAHNTTFEPRAFEQALSDLLYETRITRADMKAVAEAYTGRSMNWMSRGAMLDAMRAEANARRKDVALAAMVGADPQLMGSNLSPTEIVRKDIERLRQRLPEGVGVMLAPVLRVALGGGQMDAALRDWFRRDQNPEASVRRQLRNLERQAKAEGFNTDEVLYSGWFGQPTDQVDIDTTSQKVPAVWFTPSRDEAGTYIDVGAAQDDAPADGVARMYAGFVRGELFVADKQMDSRAPENRNPDGTFLYDPKTFDAMLQHAKEFGYAGVRFKNIVDMSPIPHDQIAIFDKSDVRAQSVDVLPDEAERVADRGVTMFAFAGSSSPQSLDMGDLVEEVRRIAREYRSGADGGRSGLGGADTGAGSSQSRFGRALDGGPVAGERGGPATAGTPGQGTDGAGQPDVPRLPVTDRLYDTAYRYLAAKLKPDAVAKRRKAQGWNVSGWHGTTQVFDRPDAFRLGRDFGFHVAIAKPDAANERLGYPATFSSKLSVFLARLTGGYVGQKAYPIGDDANIMPLAIMAKNPLRLPDLERWDESKSWKDKLDNENSPGWLRKWVRDWSFENNAYRDANVQALSYNHKFGRDVAAELERRGYDSVIYQNMAEAVGQDSLFLWDAGRVRSAFDAFDDRAANDVGLRASDKYMMQDIRDLANGVLKQEGVAGDMMFAMAGRTAGLDGVTMGPETAEALGIDIGAMRRLVALSLQAGPDTVMQTFTHEEIHVLRGLGLFTPEQWKVLSSLARKKPRKQEAQRLLDKQLSELRISREQHSMMSKRAGQLTMREVYRIDDGKYPEFLTRQVLDDAKATVADRAGVQVWRLDSERSRLQRMLENVRVASDQNLDRRDAMRTIRLAIEQLDQQIAEAEARLADLKIDTSAHKYGPAAARIEDKLLEEVVAHAAADWADGRSYGTKIDRVMMSIRDFIESVGNWLRGNGYTHVGEVFDSVWSGEVARQQSQTEKREAERRQAVQQWMADNDVTAMAVRPGDGMMAALADQGMSDAATASGRKYSRRTWYHGTSSQFDRYSLSPVIESGEPDVALFFSSQPRLASGYADGGGSVPRDGARVIPNKIQFKNPLVIKQEDWGYRWENAAMIAQAKRDGHDAVVFEYNHPAFIKKYGEPLLEAMVWTEGTVTSATSGNMMFAFAGERAKTADMDALARAKQLEADGSTRDQIWTDTGWFRGVDGKWRFEIDDSGLRLLRRDGILPPETGQLSDTIASENVFAAYPDMPSAQLTMDTTLPGGASYSRQSGAFTLNPPYGDGTYFLGEYQRSALGHEMQHATQHREGFARGGSLRGETARIYNEYASKINSAIDDGDRAEAARLRSELAAIRLSGNTDLIAQDRDTYQRLAGEVEARAVQKRMDMTPEERRARAPWLDYDVPEDQQIVRFADGTGVSQRSYSADQEDGDGETPLLMASLRGEPLDMSPEARKERAEAMGFDTIRVYYHGSPDFRTVQAAGAFESRTTNRRNANTSQWETAPQAIYFTPDRPMAATYADDRRAFDYQNAEPNVFQSYIRLGNVLEIDAGGQKFSTLDRMIVKMQIPEGQREEFDRILNTYGSSTDGRTIRTGDLEVLAPMLGYDSFRLRNVRDTYDGSGKPGTVVAVFDPANIRSVNAAFDTQESASPLLMAALSGRGSEEPSLNRSITDLKDALGIAQEGGTSRNLLMRALSRFWNDTPDAVTTQGLRGLTVRQDTTNEDGTRSRRQVRLRPRANVKGQFDRTTGVMSVRSMRDIKTIAHEGGHSLEMLLGTPLDELKAAHWQELVPAEDMPPEPLNADGYSGVDLDTYEQDLLIKAAEAGIALQDAAETGGVSPTRRLTAQAIGTLIGGALGAGIGVAAGNQLGGPLAGAAAGTVGAIAGIAIGSTGAAASVRGNQAMRDAAVTAGEVYAELVRAVGRRRADQMLDDVLAVRRDDVGQYVRDRYSATGTPRPRTMPLPDGPALSEAFARWMERYVMDAKGAREMAPNFYEAFEDLLDAEMPGVAEAMSNVQTGYQQYATKSSTEQMVSDLVSRAQDNAWERMAADGSFDNISGKLSTAYNAIYDDLNPIAKMVQRLLAVADRNGVRDDEGRPISLKVAENPYKLMRLFRNSFNRGRMWLERGIADLGTYDVVGPSLRSALEVAFGGVARYQWNKGIYQEFGTYLVSKRAVAEYKLLAVKTRQLEVYDEVLEKARNNRSFLAGDAQQAKQLLDRREDALIRAQTRLTDGKRARRTAETAVRNIEQKLRAKADQVLAAQMARDRHLEVRRKRELQALEREARAAVADFEATRENVDALEIEISMLDAEIEQRKAQVDETQSNLDALDAAVEQLRTERQRTAKRGANRPPTLETREQHEKAMADLEAKYDGQEGRGDFREASRLVAEWTHRLLTVRYQAGFISEELYRELSARKDWYVPFQRDMTDASAGDVFFRGGAKKWSPFKKFNGSDRALINPLEVLSQDAYNTAQQIAFNEAVQSLVGLAERAGPGGGVIAERVPRSETVAANESTFDRIRETAIGLGIDPLDAHQIVQRMEQNFSDSDITLVWAPDNKSPVGPPQLPLWVNGERQHIRLNDPVFGREVFNALNGLGEEMSSLTLEMMAAPARWLRTGITTHPNFILRNLLRDIPSAFIRAGVTPFKGHLEGLRMLRNDDTEVRGTDLSRGEFIDLYNQVGGIVGGQNVASIATVNTRTDVLDLRTSGPMTTGNQTWMGYISSKVEAIESAGRLGIAAHAYRRAIAHNPDLTAFEAMQEAAFVARDVYDWGRRGSKMLAVNRVITFLNAALQGTESAARGLSGESDRGVEMKGKQAGLLTGSMAVGVGAGSLVAGPVGGALGAMAASKVAEHLSLVLRRESDGPLSANEERQLAEAYKTWFRMSSVTLFFVLLYAMMKDDHWYEDLKDGTKSTHSWVKLSTLGSVVNHRINQGADMLGIRPQKDAIGEQISKALGEIAMPEWMPNWLRQYVGIPDEYRIPKPFEWAIPGNVAEIIWDRLEGRDPRAAERIRASAYEVLAPPGVPQAAELLVGLTSGYDIGRGRPIVGGHLAKLAPHQQFDAYASELAIDVSKGIYDVLGKFGVGPDRGISPKMVDWVLSNQGAYWGKDIANLYGGVKRAGGLSNRENSTPYDLWLVAGVTGRGYRNSKSIEEFWKLHGQEGGKFQTSYQTYRTMLDQSGDPAGATEFLTRLPPEERAYALLKQHFRGNDEKGHPLERVAAAHKINQDLRKDMILGRLAEQSRRGKRDFDARVALSPAKQTEVHDILERLSQIEVRNAMITLEREGWKGRPYLDPDPVIQELKASSPEVYELFDAKRSAVRLREWSDVRGSWPKNRDELLKNGADAALE